jgi:transcriptional regulator with XRE-family HTH domain
MVKTKNNLRLARQLRGISQYELARQTNIFQSKISQFELGYSRPKPDELKKMAEVLCVKDIAELYSPGQTEAK